MKKINPFLTAFVLALLFQGCTPSKESKAPFDTKGLIDAFIEDYFKADPIFAVQSGRHEFDGQMMDFSEAGLKKIVTMLEQYRDTIATVDTTQLSSTQQFELAYLQSEVDENLFWLSTAKWYHKNPAAYFGALSPDPYIIFEYAPLDVRMQALTQHLEKIPVAVGHIQNNLGGQPMPVSYQYLGTMYFTGLSSYLENDIPQLFESVANDTLQTSLQNAISEASSALAETADWIQQVETDSSFALGKELYTELLYAAERVDMPLSELKRMGEEDLERNLAELKKACDAYAPGKSLSACVAQSKAQKPEGGPVKVATQQLDGLKQFVIDQDIVSIPGTEECKVDEAPPYRRSNAAYIQIPGPFEEGLSSTYYIAPPDPNWTQEEQNKYIPGVGDLKYISVHEVWPGHFLQFLHSNRSESLIGKVFVGYAFAEGWAHYTEEMMFNQGLDADDPEMHIGQLTNALLRNVRYLSSIGLHTEGMTVEESEKLFVEKAFQDIGNARQQAARGTYDPLYLNYTLGKLLILKLREKWMVKNNRSLKEFHDTFLSYGGPPIPLVMDDMRN